MPVFGALIHWSFDRHTMIGSTDVKGKFAFRLPVTDRRRGENVEVSVESNFYQSQTASAEVCPGSIKPIDFRLEPKSKRQIGTVLGQVINSTTSEGLPGADVAILIGRFPLGDLRATTDSEGKFAIRGVGFSSDLTIQVTTNSPPCVPATARRLRVHQEVVTETFNLPLVVTGRLQCPPVLTGPEPGPFGGNPVPIAGPAGNPVPATGPAGNPLPDDRSIRWQIATNDAILTNDGIDAWNSGHLNDILKVGPFQAVVASDTGGVWSLAWNSNSAAAIPLSTNWGSINMTSLARGPDGVDHVYAGTYGGDPGSPGGVLWETDTSSAAPLLNWVQDSSMPQCGTIEHILVINEFRRIVVACDSGIWWSPIPPAPSAHGTYHWLQALPGPGLNPNTLSRHFARLGKGPGWIGTRPVEGTIVASTWGGAAPLDLIFYGGWSNGQLVLNPANVFQGSGNLFFIVDRTSVAACPADPHIMYAVASDPGSNPPYLIAAVWKSTDGGQTWGMVNQPGPNAGNQGWWNQAITVSPADCNTFAIGWRENTFVSFDGGDSYTKLDDGLGINGHLHGDYHAVLFDPDDPHTIFMGSDGGLASASGVVAGGTPIFASYYNQHIFDLQFYHGSPSFQLAGLIAGPLQDNGVAWTVLGVSGSGWWTRIVDSDGEYTEFAGVGQSFGGFGGTGDILAYAGNSDNNGQWAQSIFSAALQVASPNPAIIPVANSNNPRDPAGISGSGSPAANVRAPAFSNSAGQLIYMVTGRQSNVYGLFANSDGSDVHWESIGSIGGGQNVTAVSSFNGNVVFVGTDQGNIYQLTQPYTGPAVQFTIDEPMGGTGPINALLEFFPSIAFAATGPVPGGPGFILNFLGQTWQAVGGGLPSDLSFMGLDGPDLGSVFAASTNQVFVTHDLGTTWLSASDGLPTVAHSTELHFVVQPDATRYLYLSSYGWSMFRTPLP